MGLPAGGNQPDAGNEGAEQRHARRIGRRHEARSQQRAGDDPAGEHNHESGHARA